MKHWPNAALRIILAGTLVIGLMPSLAFGNEPEESSDVVEPSGNATENELVATTEEAPAEAASGVSAHLADETPTNFDSPEEYTPITNCECDWTSFDWYTGQPIEPSLALYYYDSSGNQVTLEKDVDYLVSYRYYSTSETLGGLPTDIAFYTINVEGIGSFSGSQDFNYEIADLFEIGTPHGMQHYIGHAEGTSYWQTGSPVIPDITLNRRGDDQFVLTPGVDFRIASYRDSNWNEMTDAPTLGGFYFAIVEGIGSYHGTKEVPFFISNSIVDCDLHIPDEIVSDGTPIGDPAFGLSYTSNGITYQLTQNTDFEVAYYEDQYGQRMEEAPSNTGLYWAVLVGKGMYSGERSVQFEVTNPYDISNYSVHKNGEIWYTGSPIAAPEFVVYRNHPDGSSTYLTEGIDFIINGYQNNHAEPLAGMPVEVGTYQAVIQGIGMYSGSLIAIFGVEDPNNINRCFSFSVESTIWYTGKPITEPTLIVSRREPDYLPAITLIQGTDFRVKGYLAEDGTPLDSLPVEAGSYYATVEGIDAYSGEVSVPFNIQDPNSIDNFSIWTNGNVWHTGEPISEPAITVRRYAGGGLPEVTLAQGRDFRVKGYAKTDGTPLDGAPVEVGPYSVIVEGIGAYSGETSVWFEVRSPNDIGSFSAYVSETVWHTGEPISEPAITVRRYADGGLPSVILTQGTDFRVTGYRTTDGAILENTPIDIGQYYISLEGIGAYSGTQTVYFEVKDPNDLSNCNATQHGSAYPYTGSPVRPDVTLKTPLGITLNEGRDCLITYQTLQGESLDAAPTEIGNYRMVFSAVEGSGYSGEYVFAFNIFDIHDVSLYSCYTSQPIWYTGEPITEPQFNVTYYDSLSSTSIKLVQGIDYRIAGYVNVNGGPQLAEAPSELGSYYAIIEGIGNYYGTARGHFEIKDPHDLSNMIVSQSGPRSFVYTGDPIIPSFTLSKDYNSQTLFEGRDYTVSYRDGHGYMLSSPPVEVGSYMVVFTAVEGSGYTGMISASFEIVSPDLAKCSISLGNLMSSYEQGTISYYALYTGLPILALPHVSFYGNTLSEGTDYEVEYDQNVGSPDQVTTATVRVKGLGKYAGTEQSITFDILPKIDLNLPVFTTYIRHDGVLLWNSTGTPTSLELLHTGSAVLPKLSLSLQSSMSKTFFEGFDYGVTYEDEDGQEVIPTDVGTYNLVIKALPGSQLTGRRTIPVSIVQKLNLASYSHGISINNSGGTDNLVEVIKGTTPTLSLTSYYNGGNLVEGYDFDFSSSLDETTGICTVTATGKGKFEGSVSARYQFVDSLSNGFEGITFFVNGQPAGSSSSSISLSLDEEGFLKDPIITANGKVNGVDYRLAEYYDTMGNEVVVDTPGIYQMHIVGIGIYAGAERLIRVQVQNEQEEPLRNLSQTYGPQNTPYCYLQAEGVVHSSGTQGDTACILKNEANQPPAYSVFWSSGYGSNLLLVEGVDYTTSYTYDLSVNTASITFTGIEEAGYTGSRTESIALVDSFDIATCSSIYLDINAQNANDRFYLKDSIEPKANVFPNISSSNREVLLENVDYRITYLREDGSAEYPITSPGRWTMHVYGIGNWSGYRDLPISVEDYSNQDISLSEAESYLVGVTSNNECLLVDGKAEPEVSVSFQQQPLEEGKEYTVEYVNQTEPGAAYALITAVPGSGFAGMKSIGYRVVSEYDMSHSTNYQLFVRLPNGEKSYMSLYDSQIGTSAILENGTATLDLGVAIRKGVKTANGRTTYEMIDLDPGCYEVEYGNNDKPGIAWVKVTGKNGYTGSLSANFIVKEKPYDFKNGWNIVDGKTYYYMDGHLAEGEKLIDGKRYYFNFKGVLAKDTWMDVNDGRVYCGSDGVFLIGLQTVGGKKYLFNDQGRLSDGFVSVGASMYYYYQDGTFATGEQWIDGKGYYFKKTGALLRNTWTDIDSGTVRCGADGAFLTGYQVVDGKKYLFDERGRSTEGFVTISGTTYYLRDGAFLAGEQWIEGSGYYFKKAGNLVKNAWLDFVDGRVRLGADGAFLTGLQTVDGKIYYFNDQGRLSEGFVAIDDATYYFYADGTYATGEKWIDGKGYQFGDNGALIRGAWISLSDGEAYAGADGAFLTGYQVVDGKKYLFDEHGRSTEGFVTVGASTYYVRGGAFLAGEQWIDGKGYYFKKTGALLKNTWVDFADGQTRASEDGSFLIGIHTVDGIKFFFNENGRVADRGFVTIDGTTYYYLDGAYATGEQQINGQGYYFKKTGALVKNSWLTLADGRRVYAGEVGAFVTGEQWIGGKGFYFKKTGALVAKAWITLADGKVYTGVDGAFLMGYQVMDGKKYLFDEKGRSTEGFVTISGTTYYLRDGAFLAGEQWIGSQGYYFKKAGNLVKNAWITLSDGKVYCGEAGAFLTGYQIVDGKKYLFDERGRSTEGFVTISGTTYYLRDGAFLAGEQWIEGQGYYFKKAGNLVKNAWLDLSDGKVYCGEAGAFLTGTQSIGGKDYTFDSAGRLL